MRQPPNPPESYGGILVTEAFRRERLCSEAAKLDRFWLESSALIPWLGGAQRDEGIEVFGRPEGIHSQARRRWRACGRHLPQGRHQPSNLFQLEEKIRWPAANGDAAAKAA